MLEFALILICFASLVQSSRHWVAVSQDLYQNYNDNRLKSHLN